MPKDFDIVIHGASGFTGRLVAEFMAQRYPNGRNAEGLRWAMGGRSADKLAAVRDAIGAVMQLREEPVILVSPRVLIFR